MANARGTAQPLPTAVQRLPEPRAVWRTPCSLRIFLPWIYEVCSWSHICFLRATSLCNGSTAELYKGHTVFLLQTATANCISYFLYPKKGKNFHSPPPFHSSSSLLLQLLILDLGLYLSSQLCGSHLYHCSTKLLPLFYPPWYRIPELQLLGKMWVQPKSIQHPSSFLCDAADLKLLFLECKPSLHLYKSTSTCYIMEFKVIPPENWITPSESEMTQHKSSTNAAGMIYWAIFQVLKSMHDEQTPKSPSFIKMDALHHKVDNSLPCLTPLSLPLQNCKTSHHLSCIR